MPIADSLQRLTDVVPIGIDPGLHQGPAIDRLSHLPECGLINFRLTAEAVHGVSHCTIKAELERQRDR